MHIDRSGILFPHVACGLQQAYTAIPAKDGIVVPCRAHFFGFREGAQSLFEERQQCMRWLSGVELRFGASFEENPCVVEPFVGVIELLEGSFGIAATIGRAAGELIGNGESEEPQCQLMSWFDGQDIAAN